MNKEKTLRIIALFMINLIVMFPLAFAEAIDTTEVTEETAQSMTVTLKDVVITDSSSNLVEYFIPQNVLIDVSVEINMIDLKQVNGQFVSGGMKQGSCIPFPEFTRCTFYDMPYSLKEASLSEEMIVTVTDKDDNLINSAVVVEKELSEDSTQPGISNIKVTDRVNRDINDWVSGNMDVYVYVDITDSESGVDRNSIIADLNDLNPSGSYSSLSPGSCTDIIDGAKCRFDASISLSDSKTANLLFGAADKSGNFESVSLSYNFKIDSTGPEVTDIKTDIIYNGMSYVKEIENKFTASFTEAGVGLDNSDVILDLSELGSGVMPATDCEGTNCYWNNVAITVRDGTYKIRVSPETSDKLGNKLVGSLEKDVKVDIKAPIVESVEVIPVAGSNPLIEGYIQTGNALLIKATLYEPIALAATADFSKFIKDAKDIPGLCAQDGNYWECIWETSEINIEGYIVNRLKFEFTDVVGNTDIFEHPLIVFAAETEEIDYWEASVGYPSPDGIDKELIALYDPYIYFPVDLRAKGRSNMWPLSVEIGDCVNAEGESYGAYLSSALGNKPELFNYNTLEAGDLPYKIYLKYTLERAEPPADELPIKCTLKIRTLVENQRISSIETENVTVKISYYYNPLGTLDGSIQNEIDRVSDNWLVKGKWIETFNGVFKFAKTLCRMGNWIKDISIIFSNIKDIFAKACAVGAPSVVSAGACVTAKEVGELTEIQKQNLRRMYDTHFFPACKLMSCQLWEKEWGINKKTGEQKSGFLGLGDLAREDWFLQSKAYSKQGWFGNVDPQHSLIYSVAFLCLPGVFYNLQKARVIDCQYVNCLKQTVAGMPVQMCTSQRSYGYCKFVYGEMFNLFPFASALGYLTQNVKRALSHPADSIGFALSTVCRTQCTSITPIGSCKLCTVVDTLNVGLEILCDLGIGKNCEPLWNQLKVDDSACSGITDEEEEEEGEAVV